jgi:hypothetical protein
MFYYLYEIKCLINNKIYVGVHKTGNLNDGYMGSGKAITRAITKYGVENFTKTILEQFNTEERMYLREAEIVDQLFLARPDVYNMKLGGPANFYYVNKEGLNHKVGQHLIHGKRLAADPEYRAQFSEKMKSSNKRTNASRSKTMIEKNHNKGRFWVSNDQEQRSIMVNQEDFNSLSGWYKGLRYRKK